MDTLKRIDEAGERMIDALRTVQDWVASAAETVASPIARRIPDLPIPDALRPPRASEVITSTYGFWEGLARAQRDFAVRILDAFDPAAHRKAARHPRAA